METVSAASDDETQRRDDVQEPNYFGSRLATTKSDDMPTDGLIQERALILVGLNIT